MTDTAEQKLHEDIAVAEEILSQTFEQTIRLEPGDPSGLNERPYIHRLKVSQRSAAAPETVILKQAAIRRDNDVYEPQASDGPASRLFNEWAGLQFLGEVCSDPLPVPSFYEGNRERGFIVMEDFGDGTRLDHVLLGQDVHLAEKTVIALFQTIGRMHAQTIGRASRYLEIRTALGPPPQWITNIGQIDEWDSQHMQVVWERFGVRPQAGFYDELETVWDTVRTPGPFTAYIHSDACPDNCHWVADELRLLDFEGGHYGHMFNDSIYARIPFPSCWCANRLPEAVAQQAEAAYRAALVKACPEAGNDDIFYATLVSTCIHRIFDGFFRHSLVEGEPFDPDEEWGISTIGQRCLMWFGQVARLTERYGYFPRIGAVARDLTERFRTLWPKVEDMPYYPALR